MHDCASHPLSASGESFPKRLRLLKPSEFQKVFQAASRIAERGLTFLVRSNGLGHPRLGLAIGRKAIPRAVDRSRLKRRVRESFRRNQHVLGGIDIVVWARRAWPDRSGTDVDKQMNKYWSELAARCKRS